MEYLVGFAALLVVAIFLAVTGWGLSILKARFSLDPGGQLMQSMEVWEDHAASWIITRAVAAGEDLTIPETRWKWINQGAEWVVKRTPMLMDFLGYDRQDVADDLESLVLSFLQNKVYDPTPEGVEASDGTNS